MSHLRITGRDGITPIKLQGCIFEGLPCGIHHKKGYSERINMDIDPMWDDAIEKYEKDPLGKDPKSGGSKLDAGKVPLMRGCLHYFPRALKEVARLSGIGANKYSWKGWETVPDGIRRYGDAMARHEGAIEDDFNRLDAETGVLEATAVAWNALARLELILRESEKSQRG